MSTPMNLVIPVVSVTLGPEWANELNTALNTIENHDHTSGNGKKITTAALNINADLEMNSHRLLDLPSLQLTASLTPVSGIGFENSISVGDTAGNLYWTNGAGVSVQITDGGNIVSTPASLSTMQYDATAIDISIGAGDNKVFVAVDTSTGLRTITLPLASSVSAGRVYVIKDATNTAETFNLTIAASGTNTIDGLATQVINSDGGALFVISNGVNSYKIL